MPKWLALVALVTVSLVVVSDSEPRVHAQTQFMVRTTDDAGAGSLRQAILDANPTPGADEITFAPGVRGTIALVSSLPAITDHLGITGPGTGVLAVDGQQTLGVRVFEVAAGADASIFGLTITGGVVVFGVDGGGIKNLGTLTVFETTIRDNDGGLFGGGIDNQDTLTVIDSTISGNSGARGRRRG